MTEVELVTSNELVVIYTRYYRCYALNDPGLYFFSVTVEWHQNKRSARNLVVKVVDPANGNLWADDEDWDQHVARTFTSEVEEITKDQFIDARKEFIT